MKSRESLNGDAPNRRRTRGRRDSRISIAGDKPDPESLRSAIQTWIVPLLVRQFMEEHSPVAPPTQVNTDIPTLKAVDKEDAGVNRIN